MVSVIIPCYNARQYICEALASAVAQEYVHEVILVDDCSTDDSVACVQAWLNVHAAQTADISIRVLQNAENSGVAVSRNRGVQEADGKYIAFLDADDRFAPGKLKKQVELLEQTGSLSLQYRPCADDAGRKPDTDDHAYPGENHTCRAGENECDQLFFRGCTKGDSAEISDAAQRGA